MALNTIRMRLKALPKEALLAALVGAVCLIVPQLNLFGEYNRTAEGVVATPLPGPTGTTCSLRAGFEVDGKQYLTTGKELHASNCEYKPGSKVKVSYSSSDPTNAVANYQKGNAGTIDKSLYGAGVVAMLYALLLYKNWREEKSWDETDESASEVAPELGDAPTQPTSPEEVPPVNSSEVSEKGSPNGEPLQ